MSHQQDWQFSTVQDFLRRCNWQGTSWPQVSQLPTQDSGISRPRPQSTQSESWQCQTVRTFLSQGNWDGQCQQVSKPLADPSAAEVLAESSAVKLTSTLPVGKFFELFKWEAQPVIAAIPQLNSPNDLTDKKDLNLSDLSDLF